MGRLWTDEARYRRWLEVELAVCDVLAERGVIPKEAASYFRSKAALRELVDPVAIAAIEDEVRHDVIAFLTNLERTLGPQARWIHFGMTSSDVLDTALALQLRDAARLLGAGLDRCIAVLRARAEEFRNTPMVGRTHGVHAEPTTFGLKLLVFWAELQRGRQRLERAAREVAVGKVSGAVGTFAHLEPAGEEEGCRRLGLGFAPAAPPGVQRG